MKTTKSDKVYWGEVVHLAELVFAMTTLPEHEAENDSKACGSDYSRIACDTLRACTDAFMPFNCYMQCSGGRFL